MHELQKSFWLLLIIFASGTLQSMEEQPEAKQKSILERLVGFIKADIDKRVAKYDSLVSTVEIRSSSLERKNVKRRPAQRGLN